MFKVLRKVKSKYMPQTDRHIRIPRKVIIYLQGISDRPHPSKTGRQISARLQCKSFISKNAHLISDDHFFTKPYCKTL